MLVPIAFDDAYGVFLLGENAIAGFLFHGICSVCGREAYSYHVYLYR